jgi:soluble lytic murein transglycosylase-like protein
MMHFFQKIPVFTAVVGLLALALVVGAPTASWAAPSAVSGEKLIEGARLCTQRFPLEEQRNSIPTHLLAAIATTESGRWHEGLGMNVPWPWTINVEGKGYFFSSKAEAIAQTQHLINQGHRSIDVGCMQVNLKHHAKAFATLDQAFDPEMNVAYAAKFLHDNYADLGDWIKATAAYHSRTAYYGNRYLAEIERSWNRIVAKVAAARASQTGSVATAALGDGGSAPAPAQMAAIRALEARSREYRKEKQEKRRLEERVQLLTDQIVAGGKPGYTYSWSNGKKTEDLTGLSAGTYTVTTTTKVHLKACAAVCMPPTTKT